MKKSELSESMLGAFGMGIYAKAEKNACSLLNSKSLEHGWKKDFKLDYSTEDWDLINSDKVKIEVKSTIQPYSFSKNYAKLNTPNQQTQTIKISEDKYNSITNEIQELKKALQMMKTR